jgi:uncharacterized protein involved in outer membrane biogenesis
VLALVLAWFVHSGPVRRAALRRAIAVLAERFDVALKADGLTYNLLSLRVTLTGVEVAATRTPQSPFLTADRLDLTVPRSALVGVFAINRLRLDNARIRIVRSQDGATNLPAPAAEGEPGEPQGIPITRLEIPQLALSIADETQPLSVDIPAMAVDIGPQDGTIRLLRPGQISRAGFATPLSSLDGGVAFDGRNVRLTGLDLATREASLRLDGALALLVEEPRADLRFSGRGDLAGLLRIAPDPPPVTGMVAMEGTVAGPFSAPRLSAQLRSKPRRSCRGATPISVH